MYLQTLAYIYDEMPVYYLLPRDDNRKKYIPKYNDFIFNKGIYNVFEQFLVFKIFEPKRKCAAHVSEYRMGKPFEQYYFQYFSEFAFHHLMFGVIFDSPFVYTSTDIPNGRCQ